jgi:hypothetical protein
MSPIQQKVQQAIDQFGKEIVLEVIEMVTVTDADGAFTNFEDAGMFAHAECVEIMYFDQD